jgi:hypothetical protein
MHRFDAEAGDYPFSKKKKLLINFYECNKHATLSHHQLIILL